MLLINLSEAEIQQLNYERFYYGCPIVQKRINAVYIKATWNGLSNADIGQLCDLHRHSVSYWLKAYIAGGIEALYQYNYGTNKSELDNHKEIILNSFTENPPMTTNEAKSRIEQLTGISRSPTQVRRFMKQHKMRYIKMGHIPAKADTEKQQQWLETVLKPAIEEAKEEKSHLLFMDAAHFILQPFICALWCLTRLFIKASSGRNRINVLGTVNAITKEVLTLTNTTYINADTIVDFLFQLREHYKDRPIKIVLDNARYQHCDLVKITANQLNITLLFLPPYSPNLNIIERLWKFTKKKILYAKYYSTPILFHNAVNTFFQFVNLKHNLELRNLLTLNFQFFQNQNVLNYAV